MSKKKIFKTVKKNYISKISKNSRIKKKKNLKPKISKISTKKKSQKI